MACFRKQRQAVCPDAGKQGDEDIRKSRHQGIAERSGAQWGVRMRMVVHSVSYRRNADFLKIVQLQGGNLSYLINP